MIEYLPVMIMFGVAAAFAGTFILVSFLLGPKKPTTIKQSAYECGVPPTGDARRPVSPRYFVTAILFVIFDVELVFLYPWAVNLKKAVAAGEGLNLILTMGFFFFLLVVGLLYEWRKGALD